MPCFSGSETGDSLLTVTADARGWSAARGRTRQFAMAVLSAMGSVLTMIAVLIQRGHDNPPPTLVRSSAYMIVAAGLSWFASFTLQAHWSCVVIVPVRYDRQAIQSAPMQGALVSAASMFGMVGSVFLIVGPVLSLKDGEWSQPSPGVGYHWPSVAGWTQFQISSMLYALHTRRHVKCMHLLGVHNLPVLGVWLQLLGTSCIGNLLSLQCQGSSRNY